MMRRSDLTVREDAALPGRRSRLAAIALGWAAALVLAAPSTALACSPPVDNTVAGRGPDAVVLVGTTGEPAPGGRLFHVERVYNGPHVTESPIVIAFKEGEPIGDCSYPMEAGRHLVIVPEVDSNGMPRAGFATLQADPDSAEGRAIIADAETLFGPGVVPLSVVDPTPDGDPVPCLLIAAVVGIIALGAVVLLLIVRLGTGREASREEPPGA